MNSKERRSRRSRLRRERETTEEREDLLAGHHSLPNLQNTMTFKQ